MRSAQLRVRQLVTIVAVAVFVAGTAVGGLHRPSAGSGLGRSSAPQAHVQVSPFGRRWF
jgi:hypothetical protein